VAIPLLFDQLILEHENDPATYFLLRGLKLLKGRYLYCVFLLFLRNFSLLLKALDIPDSNNLEYFQANPHPPPAQKFSLTGYPLLGRSMSIFGASRLI
jgi:hypothetical protein